MISDEVQNALKVNPAKIKSKGIKSVRKRVANIQEFLNDPLEIEEFKKIILKTIFGETEVEEYKLTDEDWENIEKLSNDKYRTWNGIMVETLNITLNARKNLKKDLYKLSLMLNEVKSNMQKYSVISFGVGDVTDLENALVGCLHDFEHIEEALSEYDLYHYFR